MKHSSILLILTLFLFSFLLGRTTAAVFASEKEELYVVIDPGHGGSDPGKVGKLELKEKDLNLILAKQLAHLFKNKGYKVILTRNTDCYVSLQERTAIIAKYKPIVTISLHQNSFPDASVFGPQVFHYSQSDAGKLLSSSVQESLNSRLPLGATREATANDSYYILKKTPTLTILVECGFLSNPNEAYLLSTEKYQNQLIRAIYLGVTEYLTDHQ